MSRFLAILLCCIVLACQRSQVADPVVTPDLMEVPLGFPEVPQPDDNAFTADRWALGKRLFHDPVLSADRSISCASCHKQEFAFSDNMPTSRGTAQRNGVRNAPTLANVAYHPYYTREGGVPTLEMQVLVPIQEHNEFGYNIVLVAERLAEDPVYVEMSHKAYSRDPDPFVITRSIACFERSLLSGNSAYDKYTFQSQQEALSPAQKRGMDLFYSDQAQCASCHNGFNFTNYAFENNGLYTEYSDVGRFRLTGKPEDMAMFKVPSLRNVAVTAPYMHDGSIQTLEEVINHYNAGGKDHPHKSSRIHPLDLTSGEQQDLIAFLQALTDESFLTNPLFSN